MDKQTSYKPEDRDIGAVAEETRNLRETLSDELKPRELALEHGVENIPSVELLAIILRTGTPTLNVVSLARHLLNRYGSLSVIAQMPISELTTVKGIGPVKALELKAALELSQRLNNEKIDRSVPLSTPERVAEIFKTRALALETENIWVIPLDSKNHPKSKPIIVSKGTINSSLAHPREIYKLAIQLSAAAIIVVHNHPSGDPTPSKQDINLTKQLIESGKILGIKFFDHIIIGKEREGQTSYFYSIRREVNLGFE
ncbi:MAG: DNA repair protein RadC [Kiritimatiellae bacterium]|jgi:DNA repair protein RadC|nr:DNA repair protein RadC [Kiritimatiellia bacterium]